MKTILFVCHANVTRSQMAAGFFNANAPTNWRAISTGTDVKTEDGADADGHMLKDTPATVYIFAAMEECGINLRENLRHQVTSTMIDEADSILALVPKEACPDFMRNSPKTKYWDVADVENVTLEEFEKVRDRIRPLVLSCADEIRETQKLA